ncbi:CPBP family intramembrane glutamic endopeptidase [Paenibacillus alkalitolerans]|uniref:CPBP family intramembrane glutamic endopeptidase n=1 Tax=Paenibacillus alkalitolerans TaxID=2799335 RepID=UPI0018F4D308|nr:CPBP family intramembrane glutamic endopeptidase [Paenibacillus alkalitolerans]
MLRKLDRRIWLLSFYIIMITAELAAHVKEVALVLPVALGLTAVILFRNELNSIDYNFVKESSYWKAVYHALVAGLIMQAVGIVVVKYGFGIASPEIGFATPLAAPLVSVLISSPLEEIIFRGMIFSFLDRRIGFWLAAIISSLLFAVSHYDYAAWLGYFGLGLVWCRIYKATGNLLIPIGSHMLFNSLVFFVRSF